MKQSRQSQQQLYLFKQKNFLPLFIVQFCGCLNDSILKNSLIILITYGLLRDLTYSGPILSLLANTVFILPFIVFASIAGQVCDRYERSQVVKIIKFSEIIILTISFYGLVQNNLIITFIGLCALGIHSTFFGPIKYSVLPDYLKKHELLSANGFIEAGTFLSILLGTIIGSYYTIIPYMVCLTAIIMSIIGLIFSFFMPKSNNANHSIKLNFNIWQGTLKIINYAKAKKQVYLSILGISWFWFLGAAILAQIPFLTKNILGGDENVVTFFLAIFSIGVGIGSFSCSHILKNKITTKYLVLFAIGLSICGIDLAFASKISSLRYEEAELKSIFVFLSKLHNWRIVIDLFFFSAIGGLYVVPLFAVMQCFSRASHRSQIIAANNLVNSVFMVASTLILSFLFYLNFTVPTVIFLVSLANVIVAISIYRVTPEAEIIPLGVLKLIFKFIFDTMYQVEVKNIENFHKAGKKVVIIANHLSYIDPALIAVYLPGKITFAINTLVAKIWWVKPFLKIINTLPIDPNNPMAVKTLINLVKNNEKIAIFPEGRITMTGSLMKIYEGPGLIAHKADATILPIRVEGPQYTHFSKVNNILKARLFPKITITILPPTKLLPEDNANNKLWRKSIATSLYDIMTQMLFESSDYKKNLFQSLIESAKIHGMNKVIMHDMSNNLITYRSLLRKSFILAKIIANNTHNGEHIGILLPNVVSTGVIFYSCIAASRVPTMINYNAGIKNVITCCNKVNIKKIYSSKQFLAKAELGPLIDELTKNGIDTIFLEDIPQTIKLYSKFIGFIGSFLPTSYFRYAFNPAPATCPAVVLFTSGTEGAPKVVALSHQNIQANRYQITAKIDLAPHDIAFNAMPMFHCFGLTGTILMSLSGIKTFFYPSPLHYKIIPEIIYDISATIIFSTNTFLNGYAQHAHVYDFYSLKYIFAGAEKLQSTTCQYWLNKYGVRIFEGYGATECAPVIAANTPMHHSLGTVGRFLPQIEYFIEEVPGINEGGLLYIKGPNIMLGYIEDGKITEPFHPKLGVGWYNTGDVVTINQEGYITIVDRVKRFAKIAGEMISLTQIENIAQSIIPNTIAAALSILDKTRGEQVVLFTNSLNIDKPTFLKALQASNLPELYLPKEIIYLKDLPLSITTKIDYPKLKSQFLTSAS